MQNENTKLIELFTSAFGVDVSAVTLISIWIFCFALARRLLGSGPKQDRGREDLARIAANLDSKLRTFYNGSVGFMLLFIDRLARDRYTAKTVYSLPKGLHPFRKPSPWSNGLFDLTLRLAIAYPIIFLIFGWVWSGQTLTGLDFLLPRVHDAPYRWLIIAGLAASFFVFSHVRPFTSLTSLDHVKFLVFGAAGFIPVASVDFVAGTVGFAICWIVTFESSNKIGLAGSFSFPGVHAIGGAFAIAIALAGGSTWGSIASGLDIIIGTVAFIITGIIAIVGKNGLFLILRGIAAFLARTYRRTQEVVGFQQQVRTPRSVITIYHFILWLALIVLAIAILRFLPIAGSSTQSSSGFLILFFVILPLVNAPVDWISLGFTRWLLGDGLAVGGTWRITIISLVDIAFAAAMMIPLTAITVVAIGVTNRVLISGGGEALLPLAGLFDALKAAPLDARFFWVYFLLFSSLVPSLVHILSGFVGLVLACVQTVFKSAELSQSFVNTGIDELVTKQTKLIYWYPAMAATGATTLFAITYLVASAVPFVTSSAAAFAKLLLTTAEWTAILVSV